MSRRTAKPDTDQQQLPFGGREAERWATLRRVRNELPMSAQAAHLVQVLEIVVGIAGDGEVRWKIASTNPDELTWCNRTRLPERSIRRTFALAERAGLLSVRRLRRADGSFDRLAVSIPWASLATWTSDCWPSARTLDGRDERTAPDEDSQRPYWQGGPANVAGPVRPIWPDRCGQYGRTIVRVSTNTVPPPPPPVPEGSAQPDADGEAWVEVVAELRRLGMTTAVDAVTRARGDQVPADHIRALIAHYEARPGAWGVGALKFRIAHASVDLAVEAGWPQPRAAPRTRPSEDPETIRERRRYEIRKQMIRVGKSQSEIEAAWAAAGCM